MLFVKGTYIDVHLIERNFLEAVMKNKILFPPRIFKKSPFFQKCNSLTLWRQVSALGRLRLSDVSATTRIRPLRSYWRTRGSWLKPSCPNRSPRISRSSWTASTGTMTRPRFQHSFLWISLPIWSLIVGPPWSGWTWEFRTVTVSQSLVEHSFRPGTLLRNVSYWNPLLFTCVFSVLGNKQCIFSQGSWQKTSFN